MMMIRKKKKKNKEMRIGRRRITLIREIRRVKRRRGANFIQVIQPGSTHWLLFEWQFLIHFDYATSGCLHPMQYDAKTISRAHCQTKGLLFLKQKNLPFSPFSSSIWWELCLLSRKVSSKIELKDKEKRLEEKEEIRGEIKI